MYNCHKGGLWGCIELALLKTCLGSSLAEERTICKFSFLLCSQKTGSDHPDSEGNMLKFMFALQQGNGAHWKLTALQSGAPSPRGDQTKLGRISDGQRVRLSPGGVKLCSSVLLLGYRFCSWNCPRTDASLCTWYCVADSGSSSNSF